MAAFVVHDLKNLIAQQSLLVSNAGKYKHNPEFVDDMISTVDSSVARMNRLLQQLKGGQPAVLTEQKIELGGLLSEIIGEKHAYRLKPALQLDALRSKWGLTANASNAYSATFCKMRWKPRLMMAILRYACRAGRRCGDRHYGYWLRHG